MRLFFALLLFIFSYGLVNAQDCNRTCFDLYNERGEVVPGTSCQPDFKPQTIGGSTCLGDNKCIIFDNTFQVNPPETLYIFAWGDGVIDTLTHEQLLALPEEEDFIGRFRQYCHPYQQVTCPDPEATFTVDIDLLNPNGECTNSAASGEIKVLAKVEVAFDVPDVICTNTPFAITNNSVEGFNIDCTQDAHYEWDFDGDGTTDEEHDGKQAVTHPGFTTTGTKTITLTGYHDPRSTCGPDTETKTITVLSIPAPKFTIGEGDELTTVESCSDDNVFTFSPATNGCTEVSLPLENITENRNATTSFRWSVDPVGGADFQNADLTLDDNVITFSDAGTYEVRLTVEDNCADGLISSNAACITVVVESAPSVSIEAVSPLCEGGQLVGSILSNGTPLNASDAQAIQWTVRGTSGETIPSFEANRDSLKIDNMPVGEYEIALTYENICGTTNADPVIVAVLPTPAITLSADNPTVCIDQPFTLTLDDNSADSYTWFENDLPVSGASEASLSRQFATPGEYVYYTETTKGGCIVTSNSVTITISSAPTADPIQADQLLFCPDEEVAFTLTLPTIDPPGATLQWQQCTVCDGLDWTAIAGANSAMYTGNTPGGYQVQVDGGGGCITTTDPVTVAVTPPPTFQLQSADPVVCAGAPLTLTLQGGAARYTWSPATGLNTTEGGTVIARPTEEITYTVQASTAAGCTRDTTITVAVQPAPNVTLTASQAVVCPGEEVALTAAQGVTYEWLHPSLAGSTEAEVVATPDQTTTYRVVGTNELGCTDTAAVQVEVRSVPGVNLDDESVCVTDPAFSLSLTLPEGVSGTWSAEQLPTGSLSPDGLFDPQLAGVNPDGHELTFTYQTTDALACASSVTKRVQVHPLPEPQFTVPPVVCVNEPVALNPTAKEASLSYFWKADNAIYLGADATHTFRETTGEAVIWLIAQTAQGCLDSVAHSVQVIAAPQVGFRTQVEPTSQCGPLTATFTNESTGERLGYAWDFGNGTTSTEANPAPVIFDPGRLDDTTYVVTLQLTNECTTLTAVDSILVRPLPVPLFLFDQDTICADYPIDIHNYSVGLSEQFAWDFGHEVPNRPLGENQTGTFQHAFPYEGDTDTTYLVTLTATNACGTRQITQPLVVTAKEVAAFYNSNTLQGCGPLEVELTSNQLPGTPNQITYVWGDGDTTRGGIVERHIYQTPGTYYPEVIVQNGCQIDACGGSPNSECGVAVRVYPTPEASFTGPASVCISDSVVLTNTSSDVVNSRWDFGDGRTYEGTNPPPFGYAQSGTYTISLATANQDGCRSEAFSREIRVNPLPVAQFDASTSSYCQADPVQIQNLSSGASAFQWIAEGLGVISTERDLSYQFRDPGTYVLTLVAFDQVEGDRCEGRQTQTIRVSRPAEPFFDIERSSGCGADSIWFTNGTRYPPPEEGTFLWDFGNGATYSGFDNAPVQVYSYPSDGTATYRVTLSATTDGCTQVYQKDIEVSSHVGVVHPTEGKPLVFNPTGQDNNRFRLLYTQVETINLRVYSREGVEVFRTDDPEASWDGYYQGALAPAGLYNVEVAYQGCGGRSGSTVVQLYLVLSEF